MTTWDVRDPSGAVVTDLAGLAAALGTTPERAVKHLLADTTLAAAAPASLLADVKAAAKPGDGTPPPIANGSFVSFRGGKGRVDLIVSKGKVPGVSDDVEATSDSPAARVVVWKDGKPTREKRAFSTHTLKRIAPLDRDEQKDPASRLVTLVAQHDARCSSLGLPDYRRITGKSVEQVFQRGVGAYPGESRTTLSRTEWALARVEHFVKAATGTVAGSAAGHDVDLLHPDHPLRVRAEQRVSVSDLDALVASLREAAQ